MPHYEVWVERNTTERYFITADNEKDAEEAAVCSAESGERMEAEVTFSTAYLMKEGGDDGTNGTKC